MKIVPIAQYNNITQTKCNIRKQEHISDLTFGSKFKTGERIFAYGIVPLFAALTTAVSFIINPALGLFAVAGTIYGGQKLVDFVEDDSVEEKSEEDDHCNVDYIL